MTPEPLRPPRPLNLRRHTIWSIASTVVLCAVAVFAAAQCYWLRVRWEAQKEADYKALAARQAEVTRKAQAAFCSAYNPRRRRPACSPRTTVASR